MSLEHICASISYLEFVNKITSLYNELLYGTVDGYFNKKSKEAISQAKIIVKKFDYESQKILKTFSFSDESNFILKKKKDLIAKIKQHYNDELRNWADEVFDEFVDNLFLELSLDKTLKDKAYNSLICAINWLSDVKKLDKNDYQSIIKELNIRFENVLLKTDLDYLPNVETLKSNCSIFIKYWDLILDDTDEFLKIDFANENDKLNNADIKYFTSAQYKLQTSSRTNFLDDINLLNSALNELQLKDDDKKYDFIKQINDDFSYFLETNKNITEEDKIKLIKRRISLFKESDSKIKKYFKKLITSSNE